MSRFWKIFTDSALQHLEGMWYGFLGIVGFLLPLYMIGGDICLDKAKTICVFATLF